MTEQLKTKDDSEGKGITIRLQWESAEDVLTVYANHLYISHAGGNEFYLVFGELGPQVDLDRDNPPECLEIEPVAKIAVSPPNMIKFSEVIQDNIAEFQERFTVSGGGDEQ
jgi:hypothetical protein